MFPSTILLTAILNLVWASPPVKFEWWCALNVELAGRPLHFLYFGRDAWEGHDLLLCQSGAEQVEVPVEVAFYSKATGFGADADSRLTVIATLLINRPPKQLESSATVPGLVEGSLVHWQIQDQDVEVIGSAATDAAPGMTDSLSLGTWVIRAREK